MYYWSIITSVTTCCGVLYPQACRNIPTRRGNNEWVHFPTAVINPMMSCIDCHPHVVSWLIDVLLILYIYTRPMNEWSIVRFLLYTSYILSFLQSTPSFRIFPFMSNNFSVFFYHLRWYYWLFARYGIIRWNKSWLEKTSYL